MSTQHTDLDMFITDLIAKRGYADAAPEIRETIHKDLKARLDEFIMTRTVSTFSKEEVGEFEKLLDEGKPPTELRQFAYDHIPDYTTFLTGTLLTFQDAYLS